MQALLATIKAKILADYSYFEGAVMAFIMFGVIAPVSAWMWEERGWWYIYYSLAFLVLGIILRIILAVLKRGQRRAQGKVKR